MIRKRKLFLETGALTLLLFVYCEYIHYYIVISNCSWPILDEINQDDTVASCYESSLRALVVTDIHLLGSKRGVWLDKVMRDWEMRRAFQTTIAILQPEVIFILGDTMDDGFYLTSDEFDEHVERFKSIFSIPNEMKMYVVVGNHDIGFHFAIDKTKNEQFEKIFDSPAVRIVTIKCNHFVLVNSMAMQGDNCFLCKPALEKLMEIEKLLKCAEGTFGDRCDTLDTNSAISSYSKPILMQHFPLYRKSDMECEDFDSAPFPTKEELFEEGRECLTRNATDQILMQIRPRLSLSGHTHHGCTRQLPNGNGMEITIPSFNWRNKNNPSIGLGVFTSNNYAFVKCAMPQQSTTIMLYTIGGLVLLLWIIFKFFNTGRRQKFKYLRLFP